MVVVYVGVCYSCEEVTVYATAQGKNDFMADHGSTCQSQVIPTTVIGTIEEKKKPMKAPWRGVKKVMYAGEGMQPSLVQLECGHTMYSLSKKKARCRKCNL